ncbi:MAG: GPW/gp25 family protein [Selenomonadaceae bacterium]|nr:GPW/gp25 family protein [Selenomonadaceae bacterium]
MEVDIDTAERNDIVLMPETELDEIIQNVRMILATEKMSVPMDREFGISRTMIDQPIGAAQARMSAAIVAAIPKYEPRAKVKQVIYSGASEDGELRIVVRIEINESKLRGGVFL